jgi:hypothetical protein
MADGRYAGDSKVEPRRRTCAAECLSYSPDDLSASCFVLSLFLFNSFFMKPGRWLFFSSAMASWMLREPCCCFVDGRHEWLRSATGLALALDWLWNTVTRLGASAEVCKWRKVTWRGGLALHGSAGRLTPTDGALPDCLLAAALSEVLPNQCPSQAV